MNLKTSLKATLFFLIGVVVFTILSFFISVSSYASLLFFIAAYVSFLAYGYNWEQSPLLKIGALTGIGTVAVGIMFFISTIISEISINDTFSGLLNSNSINILKMIPNIAYVCILCISAICCVFSFSLFGLSKFFSITFNLIHATLLKVAILFFSATVILRIMGLFHYYFTTIAVVFSLVTCILFMISSFLCVKTKKSVNFIIASVIGFLWSLCVYKLFDLHTINSHFNIIDDSYIDKVFQLLMIFFALATIISTFALMVNILQKAIKSKSITALISCVILTILMVTIYFSINSDFKWIFKTSAYISGFGIGVSFMCWIFKLLFAKDKSIPTSAAPTSAASVGANNEQNELEDASNQVMSEQQK